MPARTFAECAAVLLDAQAINDPTLVDLMALRAQRVYRALIAHGAPLHQTGVALLSMAHTQGHRVVLRADSERRDVEPLLTLAGLEANVSLLHCSDDPPRGPAVSIVRAWQVIDQRMERLEVPRSARTAHEVSALAGMVAGEWAGKVTVAAAEEHP